MPREHRRDLRLTAQSGGGRLVVDELRRVDGEGGATGGGRHLPDHLDGPRDATGRVRGTAELDDLSAEVAEILSVIPDEDRVMVTNHEAFGYFADAYDMTVVGTVIPGGDTLAEPSAADLEEIVEAITDNDVHAIFAETTSAPRLAEVVAAEVGQDVVIAELYSDSLSDADGPAATYADFMRYNATTIADALG